MDPDIQLMMFVYTHFYISVTVLSKPESKGYIELKSKNPYDKPKIDPMHLTVEKDVNRLADGVRKASEIFKRMKLSQNDADECRHLNTRSIDYWKCFVIERGGTFFHPVGTCKMGSEKSSSVVDNKLKVIGLQNVRVADASVFPDQISGNPVATILMIAERVVDFIKNDQ
ncbi:glucose dehydrogenase-like [FAD: quinone] [Leptotrombidium deliense]|uniref:Glucose dehydrogenase-like [FAD: quinone] n=1 Tax=Leptotrombidium deliense TaxID=299467 RepID=A0A443SCN0_9ACAR|nr:glucose dehydrogenase-like [FAD: quinone] [Leptotrombidium deliense]